MHNKTQKSSKSNKVTSSAATNATTNAAQTAEQQEIVNNATQMFDNEAVISTAHADAIAINNVFNALQAANPLQNSVLTLQTAQTLTNVADNIAAQQTSKKTSKANATKKQIAYIVFMHNLIAANAYTAKQIAAMCAAQFTDVKLSTINTTLTDAKNAKYTRFGQVATCDKVTKVLSFASAVSTNNAQ